MEEVNLFSCENFVAKFGNVVEHFPVLAGGLWSSRPFRDSQHLHQCLTQILDAVPFEIKQGVLRVHPDLAGRLARQGLLTSESESEQKSAGLDTMTADERRAMEELNQQYKQKFGFPFVICARENKKEAIINGLKSRLANSLEQEVLQGVEEVKKISYYRILEVVSSLQNAKL